MLRSKNSFSAVTRLSAYARPESHLTSQTYHGACGGLSCHCDSFLSHTKQLAVVLAPLHCKLQLPYPADACNHHCLQSPLLEHCWRSYSPCMKHRTFFSYIGRSR